MKIERRRIEDLQLDPDNAREHDDANLEAIKSSLGKFGQRKPIVVADGVVIAGNGTMLAAQALGWKQIDTVSADDLDELERKAYAIADNRTAELAKWNQEKLAQALADITEIGDELGEASGFDHEAIVDLVSQELGDSGEPAEIVEDEVPEVEEETVTQPGDLWVLGEHRVLCGDSTRGEDLGILMGGSKASLCFTSPPYNSKNGGYKTDYGGAVKKFYNHDCDDRTEDEWVEFCNEVLRNIESILESDSSPVVWNVMYTANCRSGYGRTMFAGKHRLTVKETICWDKGHGFPTASRGILSRNWELVFVLSLGANSSVPLSGS